MKLGRIRSRCFLGKLSKMYRLLESLRRQRQMSGTDIGVAIPELKKNSWMGGAGGGFVYMGSNHFTCIQNRFYDIAMPKLQNIYDA